MLKREQSLFTLKDVQNTYLWTLKELYDILENKQNPRTPRIGVFLRGLTMCTSNTKSTGNNHKFQVSCLLQAETSFF